MQYSQQFLTADTIREVHVEITNHCNAACPMCARNNSGHGLSQNPGWGSWAPGDENKVFNDDLSSLKRVIFCGTHGDPLVAPTLLPTLRHCKARGYEIWIFTNASAHSKAWWEEMLAILDSRDRIVFAIDGMKTNHLYRQKTKINKVLEHLELAAASDVQTQWDFLVFRHNENEIEECRAHAEKLGINSFNLRLTARFKKDKFDVYNSKESISHTLLPPLNPDYLHPNYKTMQKIEGNEKKVTYSIDCLYKKSQKIYVSSRLQVFPCCYISDNYENMKLNIDPTSLQFPLDELSLKNKSWIEILNHSFYKEDLMKSFSSDNVISRCIKTCGVVNRESNQNKPLF